MKCRGKLAVLILTYNEEKKIQDCITSVRFADEVVIIDSGSTDRTIEIATQLGVKCVYHPMDKGFAGQRNFALLQTEAQWVLYLDADERITAELASEIQDVIMQDELYAYKMPRKNIAFGQWLRYGGWYPDYSLRLYPRETISWQGVVHEEVIVSIPIKKLQGSIDHFTYNDWNSYFIKFNSYTNLMADKMYQNAKHATLLHIVFRPFWAFLRMYILKSGWRDGRLGFIMAAFHSFYTLVKYVKLYDIQAKESLSDTLHTDEK